MTELSFDFCQDIVTLNQKCTKIYFVSEGSIEIIIYNKANEFCQLEVLKQGDIFG